MVYQFYISEHPAPDRTRFALPGGRVCYIRVTAFDGDLLGALDTCRPRDDESVMNTHGPFAREFNLRNGIRHA